MPLPCSSFKQGHSDLGEGSSVSKASLSLWVGSAVEFEHLYALALLFQVVETSRAFSSGQTVFPHL